MPDQPSGFLDLATGNPADRLDRLWRVTPAHLGIELEHRMTDHLATARRDPIFPVQRQPGAVSVVATGAAVIRDQSPGRRIPGEKTTYVARNLQIGLGQQPAGIGAHQQRPITPIADKIAVEPAPFDHHIGDAKRQRAVAAGSHPEPEIGFVGEADMARIDDDQPHPALERGGNGGRVGKAAEAGIVAPQDQAAAVGDVRHRAGAASGRHAADPVSVAGREAPPPAAQIEAGHGIRRPEGVHQPSDETDGIGDRGGRWR
jgi:hypothetical protein